MGGESFKIETALCDEYALLPAFWHGMTPAEKQQCMAIFEKHNNKFSVACLKEFNTSAHIPLLDMQDLRLYIELAVDNRSHLDRGLPE